MPTIYIKLAFLINSLVHYAKGTLSLKLQLPNILFHSYYFNKNPILSFTVLFTIDFKIKKLIS